MKYLTFVAVAATLAACAQSPERIGTVNVDHDVYRTMSCDDIAMRRGLNKTLLADYTTKQNRTRTFNTITYSVIRMPLASYVGGDRSYEIGRLWGEQYALMVVGNEKRCAAS